MKNNIHNVVYTKLLPFIMARRESLVQSLIRDTTPILSYSLLVSTMGPLQFGFHMVAHNPLTFPPSNMLISIRPN